jgi:hypothetical protein
MIDRFAIALSADVVELERQVAELTAERDLLQSRLRGYLECDICCRKHGNRGPGGSPPVKAT